MWDLLFYICSSKKNVQNTNRYVLMYQPQRKRTLGHLVSTVAGTCNSMILHFMQKHKLTKQKKPGKERGIAARCYDLLGIYLDFPKSLTDQSTNNDLCEGQGKKAFVFLVSSKRLPFIATQR